MQLSKLKGRSVKIPAFAVAAALAGAAAYTVPVFSDVPAIAAENLTKKLQNGAPVAGFADLVEQVQPAVVSVKVEGKARLSSFRSQDDRMFRGFPRGYGLEEFFRQYGERFGGQEFKAPRRKMASAGSGFVISADGFIVTNNHVIEGGNTITVTFANGDVHEAELVGSDDKTDLALLKVKAKDKTFPFVKFSDDKVRVGDWVVAVGNPFGLGGTVTTGVVSAKGRNIGSGPYDQYLQIDAAINKGNSGGPAFNLNGEVIGVNTAIFSPSGGSVGIGFAIPASLAEEVIADLKDDGNVTRGWLGVVIQPITKDIADSLGLDGTDGVIVADVQSGSPADKAGLRSGDTILTLDGKVVQSPRDLARKVAGIKPGTASELELIRDDRRISKTVKIGELQKKKAAAAVRSERPGGRTALTSLGLSLVPAEDEGVRISEIDPDGPAADRGLRRGDRILEVAGIEVADPDDVVNAIERANRKGRRSVLMLVRSRDGQRFVAVPLKRA
ncbi:MAG: Do family serine endopeptidase [Pseudomonadota bacterium]